MARLEETDLVLALVPPGFDAPCAVAKNTDYVGPINAPPSGTQLDPHDAALLAEPGDPWVLLSLSTTLQGQMHALPRMLEALSTLPVRVLLTLGGAVPAGAVEAPPNVTVRDYIPHDLVLARMAAVVSHGGLSTVTAALTAGVPLVCIPQGRDQADNARRVEATGVGRAVAADAPASTIASALQDLLADPRHAAPPSNSPMSLPDWEPVTSPLTRSSGCVDRHSQTRHRSGVLIHTLRDHL